MMNTATRRATVQYLETSDDEKTAIIDSGIDNSAPFVRLRPSHPGMARLVDSDGRGWFIDSNYPGIARTLHAHYGDAMKDFYTTVHYVERELSDSF